MSSWATVTRWDTPWPMARFIPRPGPLRPSLNSARKPWSPRDGIQGQGDLRYAYGLPGGKEPFGGLADAHDLGAAVNAGRDRAGHVYAFFVSEDAAGDIRALMVGGMGQQRKAVHVADGIDAPSAASRWSFTSTKPRRFSVQPAFSQSSPAVFGVRPTATSAWRRSARAHHQGSARPARPS